ncbi:hypothetical protein D3C72_1732710 [compost metagenome]
MVGEEGREPLRHLDQHQKRYGRRLRRATAPAAQRRVRTKRPLGCRSAFIGHRGLQGVGDAANLALLVDGADRGLRKARVGTQLRCQPRGKQGVAA